MSRTFDFDAFWAEAMPEEADRPKVRVFGEDVYLPATIPARIMLRLMKSLEAGEDEESIIPVTEIYDLASSLYGQGNIDRWLNKGLTTAQMSDLVSHALTLYRRDEADTDEGNETPPTRGSKARSSKTGT